MVAAVAAAAPPPPVAVLEAIVPSPCSQLQLWWPVGLSGLPTRFAWLVGGVVYHGELNLEALAEDMLTAGGGEGAAAAVPELLSGITKLHVDGYGSEGPYGMCFIVAAV